jgi:aldose 1-epimerase
MPMAASVRKSSFGKLPDGTAVDLYTLENARGLVAKVTNYGGIVTELHVPDRHGKSGDVVLGFDNLPQYLEKHPYFGATVGRFANRIAKGRFTLEGKTCTLAINNAPNHLHGGLKGFDKVLWTAEPQTGAAVKLTYTSPDGEEGYPGTLAVAVTMSLTDANELRIDYTAKTDKATPVNLTNHSYFNLAGEGDVLSHELMIAADAFTPPDSTRIPTGQIKGVKGTPMDFTRPQPVGARFSEIPDRPVGYDHNFVLNKHGDGLALAARVYEPKSGRVMEAYTTEPGVQLYTSNFFDGSLTGKRGIVYQQHAALCLEAQHYPDAVNQPRFPSVILRPGQIYQQTTVYKFSTAV